MRLLAGPLLCLVLYATGGAHGPFPMFAALLFAALLHAMRVAHGRWATPATVLAGALFLAIGFGLVPGFVRVPVGPVSISAAKALAGIAAMTALPSHWRWNRRCSVVALACLAALPLLARAAGVVRWAPAAWTLLAAFAFANLFSVVAEEWFFRRWVQQPLQRRGAAVSIAAAALLFGLVHLGAGAAFAALAALAGVAYAGVFRLSGGSVWAAVALHWALNVLRTALFGG